MVDTDWQLTPMYVLVQKLLQIGPENRLIESKNLFESFLNPTGENIFNEEEAGYYASFLRRKAETEIIIEENQREVLSQMY